MLVSGLFLAAFVGGALAGPQSEPTYRETIRHTLEALESGKGRISPEQALDLKHAFPKNRTIRYKQTEQDLDALAIHHWIDQAREDPKGRDRLITYLKHLLGQIESKSDSQPASPGLSWEKRRTILEAIYQEKAFRHLSEGKSDAWLVYLEKILETFGRWLKETLTPPGWIQGGWMTYLVYALYGVVLIAGLLLLLWLVKTFGPTGWQWKPVHPEKGPKVETASTPSWREWRRLAVNRAKAGAYREAIRALFVSTLAEGQEQGWWEYRPEATNMELLAQTKGPRERIEALNRLTVLYEWAWYGLGNPGQKQYEEGRKWMRQLGCTA